jgi:hypothetical protein
VVSKIQVLLLNEFMNLWLHPDTVGEGDHAVFGKFVA